MLAGTSLLLACASQQPLSRFAQVESGPVLLAHRGVSQTFDPQGVTGTSCTAERIYPPTHSLLENTLDSLAAAFAAGAHIAEIDVHPTTDGEFAVFHDWTLECRTNGQGRTRDQSMAYLKTLDIGYGYTADGGQSYPFRGKAIGLMPSLREVLARFPHQRLVINVKSNDPEEGELLARFLLSLSAEQRSYLAVYGGEKPLEIIRQKVRDVLSMSKESLKNCLSSYLLFGWSGLLPQSCERTLVLVPLNYTRSFAGWPEEFLQKMRSLGSAVFVAGNYTGGPSSGIDSLELLNQLPATYTGGIWTNEIELIGSELNQRRQGS